MSKSKKIVKKNIKKSKKRRTHRKNITKGGCGCGKISGGFGGATFKPFESSPNQYYYQLNSHNQDPNSPAIMGSERLSNNVLRGGSVKNKSSGKKKSKKMRGGNLLLGTTAPNSVVSFGTVQGAMEGSNVMSGISNTNPEVYSQPVENKFGTHNVPIV